MSAMRTLLLFPAIIFAASVHAQRITNPNASVVDVPTRQAELRQTTDPLLLNAIKHLGSCVNTPLVPAPIGPMNIPHHYLANSHGPTNPAEKEATVPYEAFEHRITAGMNQFLAAKSPQTSHAEAACALAQLDAWAQGKAVTDYDAKQSSQSWFQSEWTLSAAGVTMSVLVNDAALDPAQVARVNAWLHNAVVVLLSHGKPDEPGNNHKYWRALAATSIGIVTNDNKLFDYGVTTYKQAIGQLDKNGAFPLEMARHEMSIHYQSFALQPLVVIAQFAARQGTDLYAYAANGNTLRSAVDFLGRALADPAIVQQYTTDAQRTDLGSSDFAPFAFVAARFATQPLPPTLADALHKPLTSTRIGGSTTLMAAPLPRTSH